jgi:hypothetical protein
MKRIETIFFWRSFLKKELLFSQVREKRRTIWRQVLLKGKQVDGSTVTRNLCDSVYIMDIYFFFIIQFLSRREGSWRIRVFVSKSTFKLADNPLQVRHKTPVDPTSPTLKSSLFFLSPPPPFFLFLFFFSLFFFFCFLYKKDYDYSKILFPKK